MAHKCAHTRGNTNISTLQEKRFMHNFPWQGRKMGSSFENCIFVYQIWQLELAVRKFLCISSDTTRCNNAAWIYLPLFCTFSKAGTPSNLSTQNSSILEAPQTLQWLAMQPSSPAVREMVKDKLAFCPSAATCVCVSDVCKANMHYEDML